MFIFVFAIALSSLASPAQAKYYPENKDNIYVHKRTDQKTIALTFDDGPHPEKTEKILEVLDKYGIKATFFIIGENAEQNPDIVKKISEMGHEIGNHTYDHKSIYKLSGERILQSVKKCEDIIKNITGSKTTLFRPPEGYLDDTIASSMLGQGYDVILWRVDTYDWQGKSAEAIYSSVVKNVKCGDIILMHDYISRKSNTAQALDMIIPTLIDKGYEFVTISNLIDS